MSKQDPTHEEPPESGALPPDHDAPGQVDYPDPAFDDVQDEYEAEIETPDAGEPEAPDDEDEDDEDEEDEE